jgi:DeoR/GlpR family transcriptional regulator of sugar metabolism
MTIFLEERRKDILTWILDHGRVSVSELSEHYGVSEVTIRADLQALENQELILRTHGGAIPNKPELTDIALNKRIEKEVEEKSRIGQAAARLISHGETIFLDSSTTSLAIARQLINISDLTVVTNSLAISQELMESKGISILLIGGLILRDDASTYGWPPMDILNSITIQKGFFGAHGIDIDHGLTDLSPAVAEVKKAVLKKCREAIAVLDATKWGKIGLAPFASLHEIKTIITGQAAPAHLLQQIAEKGVQIFLV